MGHFSINIKRSISVKYYLHCNLQRKNPAHELGTDQIADPGILTKLGRYLAQYQRY